MGLGIKITISVGCTYTPVALASMFGRYKASLLLPARPSSTIDILALTLFYDQSD